MTSLRAIFKKLFRRPKYYIAASEGSDYGGRWGWEIYDENGQLELCFDAHNEEKARRALRNLNQGVRP